MKNCYKIFNKRLGAFLSVSGSYLRWSTTKGAGKTFNGITAIKNHLNGNFCQYKDTTKTYNIESVDDIEIVEYTLQETDRIALKDLEFQKKDEMLKRMKPHEK